MPKNNKELSFIFYFGLSEGILLAATTASVAFFQIFACGDNGCPPGYNFYLRFGVSALVFAVSAGFAVCSWALHNTKRYRYVLFLGLINWLFAAVTFQMLLDNLYNIVFFLTFIYLGYFFIVYTILAYRNFKISVKVFTILLTSLTVFFISYSANAYNQGIILSRYQESEEVLSQAIQKNKLEVFYQKVMSQRIANRKFCLVGMICTNGSDSFTLDKVSIVPNTNIEQNNANAYPNELLVAMTWHIGGTFDPYDGYYDYVVNKSTIGLRTTSSAYYDSDIHTQLFPQYYNCLGSTCIEKPFFFQSKPLPTNTEVHFLMAYIVKPILKDNYLLLTHNPQADSYDISTDLLFQLN